MEGNKAEVLENYGKHMVTKPTQVLDYYTEKSRWLMLVIKPNGSH